MKTDRTGGRADAIAFSHPACGYGTGWETGCEKGYGPSMACGLSICLSMYLCIYLFLFLLFFPGDRGASLFVRACIYVSIYLSGGSRGDYIGFITITISISITITIAIAITIAITITMTITIYNKGGVGDQNFLFYNL